MSKIQVKEHCKNCKFYFHLVCKRHSPLLFYNNEFITKFPTTYPSDWCGDWEYQEDVNKRLENENG